MIWATDHIKLFISHRDAERIGARRIADALSGFGFSAFVAHESIAAGETWRQSLLDALETMDAMLVLLGDQESVWVDQEIGFARARKIPIFPVCFQDRLPRGFLEDTQALRVDFDSANLDVQKLVVSMIDALEPKVSVKDALISSFLTSKNWSEACDRFNRMENVVTKIGNDQATEIINRFLANDQLHCGYLTDANDRFLKFLNRTTGRLHEWQDKKISVEAGRLDQA